MTAALATAATAAQLERALLDAATAAIESMSFAFATETVDADQAAARLDCVATVRFDGPCRGALVLAIYGEMLGEIAANMLGEDTVPTRAMQRDALGELANVICGNVTPELAGAVFTLGAPRVDDVRADVARSEPFARQRVGLDGGRVELALYLEGT